MGMGAASAVGMGAASAASAVGRDVVMKSWLMEIWRLATCGDGLHGSSYYDDDAGTR